MTRSPEAASVTGDLRLPGFTLQISSAQMASLANSVEVHFLERLIDALQGGVPEGPTRDSHRARYRALMRRATELGFASEHAVAVFAAASDRFGDGFEAEPTSEAGKVAAATGASGDVRAQRLVTLLDLHEDVRRPE
jgi:hypothetical protein